MRTAGHAAVPSEIAVQASAMLSASHRLGSSIVLGGSFDGGFEILVDDIMGEGADRTSRGDN